MSRAVKTPTRSRTERARKARRKNLEEVYRLSPVQRGMLFHDLYDPDAGEYVIQFVCTLDGTLDVDAFSRAWGLVLERHPILRTSFHWEGLETSVQVVHREVEPPLHTELWDAASDAEDARRMDRYLEEDRRRNFELTRPPLMRLVLLEAPGRHLRFLWSFHHLLLDGWSIPLVLRDLFRSYGEIVCGRTPELPSVPRYREFVKWLERQDLEASRSFWERYLEGVEAGEPLPEDRGAHNAEGVPRRIGRSRHGVSPTVSDALDGLARRLRVSPNTLVQAAWAVVLSRHLRRSDVVFGMTISGRPPSLRGVESMVGLFINTLPVRSRVPEAERVDRWLPRLADDLLRITELGFTPVGEVQRWSGVPASRPLFETLVVYENLSLGGGPELETRLQDLEIRDVRLLESSNYPLAVLAVPGRELTIRAIYDRRRFDEVGTKRLLRHMGRVLEGMAERPGDPVGALPLLTQAELHQLVRECNDTVTPYRRDARIETPFFERALQHPDAPAVLFEGRSWTYREVAVLAETWALRLRRLGVERGAKVGVFLERSPAMVWVLLGVLRAGGTYVPLDPEYPDARLAFILKSLEVQILVVDEATAATGRSLVDRLPALQHLVKAEATEALGLDDESAPALPESARTGDADDVAYVIFTSGTTGMPKGVVVRHRPVLNLFRWVNETFSVGPGDRLLFLTSLCFDLSVYDVFGMLAAGGVVRIATREEVRDPRKLVEILIREPVTFWDSAPAALQQLAPLLPEVRLASEDFSLRLVFLSGDWIPLTLPDRIREVFPEARVISLGGATEATVWSNVFPVAEIRDGWTSIPYGRPISNARYYVLDRSFRPCPMGVPGDLYIGGDCLSTGYAGRPALTADRYLPDPYGVGLGKVMYRTGDQARFFDDGNLEFLGRVDHQVKIRGYRIELGEIESVLTDHPGVGEAVAAVHGGEKWEDKRIVAYYTHHRGAGAAPEPDVLRDYLLARLPPYMVPFRFVRLDAMPVTPNGKLDRASLPAPDVSPNPDAPDHEAPRGDTEERLAGLWSEVLGVDAVGRHDDFFELGGDSILSIQIVSRASKAGLELTPRHVFQHPTVAQLAEVVTHRTAARKAAATAEGPVPLTPIQHWFFEGVGTGRPHHWNQSLVLAVDRSLSTEVLEAGLAHVVREHPALCLRFERDGEHAWHACYAAADAAASRIEVSEMEEPLEIVARRLQTSLDLRRGPVLAAARIVGDDAIPDRFVCVAHHLVIDGVSWRILLEDLQAACRDLLDGREPEPGGRSASWTEWAEGLTGLARSDEMRREAAWWLEALPESLPPWPVDSTQGPNDEASAATVRTELEPEATHALLRRLPATSGAHIDELLLSAALRALADWSGLDRIQVDLENHGREDVLPGLDLSRTVGWLTALFPVVFDLPAGAAPRAALASIKQTLRSVPRRGVGYGVVRFLNPDGEMVAALAKRPGSPVSFNYLGRLDRGLSDDSLFRPAEGSTGPDHGSEHLRRHLLEMVVSVLDGRLRLAVTYSRNRHEESTVRDLADRWRGALEEYVSYWTTSDMPPVRVPAEFPLAKLTFDGLETVLSGDRELGDVVDVEDVYPATPLQEAMLVAGLAEPDSELYVEQLSCVLEGDLDVDAFTSAWARVVARHPVLRTSFVWDGVERPLQRVEAATAVPVHVEKIDLRRSGTAAAWLEANRRRGFDLTRAPLMRWALLRRGDAEWVFVWTFHHAILDGWSLPRVLGEVFGELERRDDPGRLTPAPPFRDYVAWLQDRDTEAAEAFWAEALEGFRSATPLGVDVPPMRSPMETRGRAELTVSPRVEALAGTFVRSRRLTWNTLLEGAWGALLARYSGEPDVVFGSIVSGRPGDLPGADEMIGLFIQTLPVRLQADPNAEIETWLHEVQERRLTAAPYESTPLHRIRHLSEVLAGEPLFESLFVFENYPVDRTLDARRPGGLILRDLRFVETTELPLALVAVPGDAGDGLRLRASYDPQRFEPSAVERLLRHWAVSVERMASGAATRLGQVSFWSDAERQQLLVEWAREEARWIPETLEGLDGGLHEHVRRRLEARPDSVAFVFEGWHLTCGELLRRAGRIAGGLRRLGVGPESRVGLAMDRGLALGIGVLGILAAGGVYVPLDPEWPASRLRAVLAPADLTAAISEGSAPEALVEKGIPVLELHAATRRGDVDLPPVQTDCRGGAYVLFTSGTTGRPKGVVIPHGAIVHHLLYRLASGQVRPGDRFLVKASVGFDVSLLEIFLPLLADGISVVARPGGQRDPEYLARRLAEERITQAPVPPSLLRLFLELQPTGLESLWSLASGSEALAADLEARIHEAMPQAVLFNRYGPTESSIAVSSWRCEPGALRRQVPIGRPMAGARLYVLDAEMRPVPVGRAGELHIGGVGLARGYLGEPGRTAAAFVPHPWADPVCEPGTRLYRTGDRVRRRADGALEFLGRLDHQVQIRGHRVEPAEIEAVIAEDSRIEDVAVVLRGDAGAERLVAYVGTASGRPIDPKELRARVRDRLPGYMTPGVFVRLNALPRTSSGKVDRRALPEPPEVARPTSEAGPDLTEGAERSTSERLQAVFSDVLGVDAGPDDDFFELGGDSILSLQVISKARQAGLALDVRQLFTHPTPSGLALVTRSAGKPTSEQGPVVGPVELTPIQHRFFEVDPVDPHHFTQALWFRPSEELDPEILRGALAAVLAHHDALRAVFHREPDGTWRQDLAKDARVWLDRWNGRDASGDPEASAEDAQSSLSLEDGRLHRAILYRREAGEPGRLLWTFHHLVMDGVSWRIVVEDLETAYRQLASGAEVRLPPKTTSIRAWAERLVRDAERPERLAEAEYWLDPRCREAPPLPQRGLDTEPSEGADLVGASRTLRVELDPETTEGLLRIVPETYGNRIDEVLLTALVEAVAPRTGRRLLRVALEKHGRDHPFENVDLSRTVGWFTTLVPVVLDLRGRTEPGDILRAVKEQLRAIPDGGLGYAVLRYLGPPEIRERLAAEPSPEIVFNYLGQVDPTRDRDGLLTPSSESIPRQRSPRARRRHRLEINGMVREGRLVLGWTYSPERDPATEVRALAEDFLVALRRLVDHCRSPEAGGYTPSDFPEVQLDQGQLDDVLGQLE